MRLWVIAADLVVPCEDIKVSRQAVIGPFSRAAPRIGVHTSAPALLSSTTEPYMSQSFLSLRIGGAVMGTVKRPKAIQLRLSSLAVSNALPGIRVREIFLAQVAWHKDVPRCPTAEVLERLLCQRRHALPRRDGTCRCQALHPVQGLGTLANGRKTRRVTDGPVSSS